MQILCKCKSQNKWPCVIKDNGLKTICHNIESFLKGQPTVSQGFLPGCLGENQVEKEGGGNGIQKREYDLKRSIKLFSFSIAMFHFSVFVIEC